MIPEYVSAICREIEHTAQHGGAQLPVSTIYFGGGTPSLLNADHIEKILDFSARHYNLQPDLEVSLEANPGTLSQSYLINIRALGVNRLSIGVQSSHPEELQLLGRIHSYPEAIRCFTWARNAGFENINLDLIFGLPDQEIHNWSRTLAHIVKLEPNHLSLYALTIEEGTPFGIWAKKGLFNLPDPDLAADMYEFASAYLEDSGYLHYEISNWAVGTPEDDFSGVSPPAYACCHNLQYWHNKPYLGIGAGAHGFICGMRTENVRTPTEYIKLLSSKLNDQQTFPCTPATKTFNRIDRISEIGETMIMGLRLLREGVSASEFKSRFGSSLEDHFHNQIKHLQQLGLIELLTTDTDFRLRLSKRGYLLANQVFIEFI